MTATLLAIWIEVADFDSFTAAIEPFNWKISLVHDDSFFQCIFHLLV
jgi:hypothetical protein